MKSDKKFLPEWKDDWNRAKDFLKSAENNLNLQDYKTAANRIYFSAESAVVAALKFSSKPISTNHKNIWELSKLLEMDMDIYSLLRDLYDSRLQADYGYTSNITVLNSESVNKSLLKVKKLLSDIEKKYKFK